jgi:alpha-galactosidase
MLDMRRYFYGDFYPLVSYSRHQDSWAAWQYDLPEEGEGMVVVFRRPKSPFPRLQARLMGLDAAAEYRVHSCDAGDVFTRSGRALMSEGFAIEIDQKPGSALFEYSKSP